MNYPDLSHEQQQALYTILEDRIGKIELNRLIDTAMHN